MAIGTTPCSLNDHTLVQFIYAQAHSLPVELLFTQPGGWLGLQRIYARIRSFEEVVPTLRRQPNTKSPYAVIAAGPGEGHERITAIAEWIGTQLSSTGFSLRPADRILSDAHLGRWSFLDSIDRESSMIVFVGHGGYDNNGPFLQLSTKDL